MIQPAPLRIDSHCHIWALSRGDYDWLDVADPTLGPIAQDFGIGDLALRMDAAGIDRAILVQAAPTEAETRFMLGQAAQAPQVAGVVGWVDLTAPDVAARVAALAQDPLLRGIRPMLQDLAPDWLATQPVAGWADVLIAHGLRFDALVRPAHLATLHSALCAHPDLPVVIDHAAKPALAAPADDPRHALWRDGMARLAGETTACCKLSGLLTEMAEAQLVDPRATLFPLLDQLLGWFGPERLMWGSDWPVLRLAGSYAGWHGLFDAWVSGQPEPARAQITGGTAARFYGVAP
jgi:L-fuconolactonase